METDNDDVDADLITPHGYVEWGDGPQSGQVATVEELDELLDRVDAEAHAYQRPVLALVGLGGTRYLTVGLGADYVGLTYNDFSEWQSWSSLGDLTGDYETGFWLGNQPTYVRRRELIPIAVARQAVREMYGTGERAGLVGWYEP
jgi:hypothetical protein